MSKSFRIGRFNIYVGKIKRGCNGSNPPWRGYCWGSDIPRVSVQRGPLFVCVDFNWLCYFASIHWSHPHE